MPDPTMTLAGEKPRSLGASPWCLAAFLGALRRDVADAWEEMERGNLAKLAAGFVYARQSRGGGREGRREGRRR